MKNKANLILQQISISPTMNINDSEIQKALENSKEQFIKMFNKDLKYTKF